MGEQTDWKATDSSPVDTKQKNGTGVQNQTTSKSVGKSPIATILVAVILLVIVGFFLHVVNGAAT